MTKFPVGARITFMMKGRAFCMSEVDIRRAPWKTVQAVTFSSNFELYGYDSG